MEITQIISSEKFKKSVKLLSLVTGIIFLCAGILLLLPSVQNLVFRFAENFLLHRPLRDLDKWQRIIWLFSCCVIYFSFVFFTISFYFFNILPANLFSALLFLLCFLFIFLIISSRNMTVLFTSYLWAEDGAVFLPRAIQYGIKSLFMQSAGYFHVISQASTILALKLSEISKNGIKYTPLLMQFFALTISAFSMSYFCRNKFSWCIKKQAHRLLVCLALAVFANGNTYEVWHTITNAQWWYTFLIFLIGLDMFYHRDFSCTIFETILLFLIGLSTPLGILTMLIFSGIFFLKFYDAKKIQKRDLCLCILIFIPVLLQIFIASRTASFARSQSIIKILFYSFFNFLVAIPSVLYQFITRRVSLIFLGIGAWGFVISSEIKNKRNIFIFAIFFIYGYILMSFLRGAFITLNGSNRYYFIPQIVFIFLVSISILDSSYNLHSKSFICILIIVAVGLANFKVRCVSNYTNTYNNTVFLYNKFSDKSCVLRIEPNLTNKVAWTFSMPFHIDDLKTIEKEDVFIDFEKIDFPTQERLTNPIDAITISGILTYINKNEIPKTVITRLGNKFYVANLHSTFKKNQIDNFENEKVSFDVKFSSREFVENNFELEFFVFLPNEEEYFVVNKKLAR